MIHLMKRNDYLWYEKILLVNKKQVFLTHEGENFLENIERSQINLQESRGKRKKGAGYRKEETQEYGTK